MKTRWIAAMPVLLVLIACAAACAAKVSVGQAGAMVHDTPLLPGIYRQVNPSTRHLMRPGNEIVVTPVDAQSVQFTIHAIRARDLNSGSITGTTISSVPSSWSETSPTVKCLLKFKAAPHGFVVTQVPSHGDCGFGYGVFADGTYVQTPR